MSSWEEVTDTEAHDKSGELSNRGCSPVSQSGPLITLLLLHHSQLFLTNIFIQSVN